MKEWLEVQPDIAFYKASDRYNKGVSDFIICVAGIFVCAELKADDGIVSAHQKLFLSQFVGVGAIGGVCYTLGDVKLLVEEARRRVGNT